MRENDEKTYRKIDIRQSFHVGWIVCRCFFPASLKTQNGSLCPKIIYEVLFISDDHSRVILKTDTESNAYINANYIQVRIPSICYVIRVLLIFSLKIIDQVALFLFCFVYQRTIAEKLHILQHKVRRLLVYF